MTNTLSHNRVLIMDQCVYSRFVNATSFLLFTIKVCFCVFLLPLAKSHEGFGYFEPFLIVKYQILGFEDSNMRYTFAMLDSLSHMFYLSIYVYTHTHGQRHELLMYNHREI